MDYPAHVNIFRAAVAALPDAIQARLAPHEDLFDDAGNYPDIFDNGTLAVAIKDAKDPDWRRFCLYPEELAGRTMHSWPFPKEQQRENLPLIRYLMGNAVDAWQADDIRGAIKFVGCMSHYLGDITQPAHLLDQQLMAELFPAPPSHSSFHYHWTVEAVIGKSAPLDAPMLLGSTLEEAVWRQSEFNRRAISTCRGAIGPLCQALFRDDHDEAVRISEMPVTIAAEGTRDIFYTIVRLAESDALPASENVDLRTWKPDASRFPVAYGEAFVDESADTHPSNGRNIVVPAKLRDANHSIVNVRGLGVITGAVLTYGLPKDLFDRFEAQVGLHPEIAQEGNANFIVELDGEPVWASGAMTASDAARAVSVPLGDAIELTLRVADPSGGLTFYHNHAIWADPVLVVRR